MIKIPTDILTPEELAKATGMAEKNIEIEFTGISIEKKSLTLLISIKLNFVMPKSLELKIRRRFLAKLDSAKNVRFSYIYTNGASGKGSARVSATATKKNGAKKSNGKTVYGKKIKGEPMSYQEIFECIGESDEKVTEGDVFSIEPRPIKSGRLLVTILIADKGHAMCMKAFMKEEKFAAVDESLENGARVRVSGLPEYDTFEHTNVFMVKSINLIDPVTREDTYPDGRRVELHVHTKMSDNDGFNEVEDLVRQSAAWGQPAVAITDHGVVQSFPDAANTAAALAKDGTKIKIIYGMEGYLYPDEDAIGPDGAIDIKKHGTYHIILLAKNLKGLRNLYKIVSMSHIDYFYKKPRLPRSVLQKYREGIIVGSACEAGEVYRAVRNGADDDELLKIASFYDYLEIQPLCNNKFLIDEGLAGSEDDLIANNLKIVEIADKLGKMTVATTDSHYPTKESAINRNIIMSGIGFKDAETDGLYLRTTDEMMEEFSYLGDRAEEIVIGNTNAIADMIDDFRPVPKEKCPPHIDGAEDTLRDSCYKRAKEEYGDPLPEVVASRLDEELTAIISNGYAVMYVAAQMLVKKSLSDGYLVGSRGSVGSSLAATMAGITEVNPLDPHYICPKCKHLEIDTEETKPYECGFDMPDKICPVCGAQMKKNGLGIPFATFLGFKGDKEPDIDLNFAGEYQATAHRYVGEIFGEKNIFKAGTVSTIAEKTAYGYVKHYVEEKGIPATKYDINYLVSGCTGVKRTTGQHPGGIIIVPDDHEIYEFCPIQKPANKRDVDMITTHFDYHKIDKNLLKLDILGHDVPSMIRHLQDMTGVDPLKIDLADKKVLSIFTSIDALDIKNDNYKFTHGTYAIPEFGTNFVRQMLDDVRPTTVSELIKISGFSHGTDVWTNNAQDLIKNKTATMNEVISCRDDIMKYLMDKGLENSDAFRIMEIVRKNRELTEDDLKLMKDNGVPDWYIQSCETLKYMFPRAHAAAYVMMAIRMAWFKVYYPSEFYAAYLTSKVDDFDMDCFENGLPTVERDMQNLEGLGNAMTAKQKDHLTVYQVVYELLSRGMEFGMPELGVSDPCVFNVVDGKIKIPFMAVNGIGKTAAESFDEEFRKKPFTSIDEIKMRTKLSGTNLDDLKKYGVLDGMPDSAQISIFDM